MVCVLLGVGRLAPGSSGAIGVVAVAECAMLPVVGDVIAQAGEPIEGIEGLEVSPQGGIHLGGVVDDGLSAVQVHELLE